jgi:hypothetical protein
MNGYAHPEYMPMAARKHCHGGVDDLFQPRTPALSPNPDLLRFSLISGSSLMERWKRIAR